jgi:NAD(P)-dependent dehydrogenase (short-subunit alcohol dehydrogenase family)
MFDLSGRTALVTGAGQGVGAGIAETLARQRAAVAVNDLHAERAGAVAARIRDAGGRAVVAAFDVTDPESVAAGVARAEEALAPVDVLVNNAGVPDGMALTRFQEMDPAVWRRYVDLNLYGVLHCTRAVLDGMCGRGFGRVVTIASAAGQHGMPLGLSLYGAGKAGAIGFMRHLALEVARSGVTANVLSLGMMDNLGDEALVARNAGTIPVGRVGTPEDVGAACVFLASDEASWITGQTLGVNGGSFTS